MVRLGPDFEAEWPGASSLATECVLNLYVLSGLIEDRSTAFMHDVGLPSMAAFNVLTILQGAGKPLPPSVISEHMMVTRGTMTGILDSLENRGMIRRRRHPGDGRGRLIEMTDRARKLHDEVRPRIHAAEQRVVASLNTRQRKDLIDAVAGLQEAASRLRF
jgi:DNA-binding MarR family transcriptional regulator